MQITFNLLKLLKVYSYFNRCFSKAHYAECSGNKKKRKGRTNPSIQGAAFQLGEERTGTIVNCVVTGKRAT